MLDKRYIQYFLRQASHPKSLVARLELCLTDRKRKMSLNKNLSNKPETEDAFEQKKSVGGTNHRRCNEMYAC
jgi:hypothetical protein